MLCFFCKLQTIEEYVMPKRLPKILNNTQINSWCILEQIPSQKYTMYRCKCICGNIKDIPASNLLSNKSKSCGKGSCNIVSTTHNLTNHPLYGIYSKIKGRIANPTGKNTCYQGITICSEWENDFLSFYTWAMNSGYSPELSIDRINGTKGYSPDNCRWATNVEQSQNRKGWKKAQVPFKAVFMSKPRTGKVIYNGTGKAPYYWKFTYNGKPHQKWGFTSAEEAYLDKCEYIKKHLDGLAYP